MLRALPLFKKFFFFFLYYGTCLKFPPHHLIDYSDVALNDLDDLGADVFVCVVRHWESVKAVPAEFYCSVYGLQQAFFLYPRQHKTSLVQGLRPLRAGSDAHRRERFPDGRKVAALLRQGPAVRDDREGVHLQMVVVVEAQGLMGHHTFV